jgi:pyruvate carboxylase subunit B
MGKQPFAKVHPGVKCAAEIIEPGIPKAKKLLEENNLPVTDENIFITGCLQTKGGNKGIDFLKGNRHIGVPKKDPNAPAPAAAKPAAGAINTAGMKVAGTNTYRVAVNGQSWDVQVSTLSK